MRRLVRPPFSFATSARSRRRGVALLAAALTALAVAGEGAHADEMRPHKASYRILDIEPAPSQPDHVRYRSVTSTIERVACEGWRHEKVYEGAVIGTGEPYTFHEIHEETRVERALEYLEVQDYLGERLTLTKGIAKADDEGVAVEMSEPTPLTRTYPPTRLPLEVDEEMTIAAERAPTEYVAHTVYLFNEGPDRVRLDVTIGPPESDLAGASASERRVMAAIPGMDQRKVYSLDVVATGEREVWTYRAMTTSDGIHYARSFADERGYERWEISALTLLPNCELG